MRAAALSTLLAVACGHGAISPGRQSDSDAAKSISYVVLLQTQYTERHLSDSNVYA